MSVSLSLVIVNYNTTALVRDCLDSLKASPTHLEIIVADNASTDGSAEMIAQRYPQVHLIQNARNEGFACASNQGIAISTARYVLLLNSDTLVRPDASIGRVHG
jgi:GT2 family glycosyltransferase